MHERSEQGYVKWLKIVLNGTKFKTDENVFLSALTLGQIEDVCISLIQYHVLQIYAASGIEIVIDLKICNKYEYCKLL